jgi:hypothetical protein
MRSTAMALCGTKAVACIGGRVACRERTDFNREQTKLHALDQCDELRVWRLQAWESMQCSDLLPLFPFIQTTVYKQLI